VAGYFVDSSALAKLYHPEIGTAAMDVIANQESNRLYISRLTMLEIRSVFAIKVRTQFISREDAEAVGRQFFADVLAKRFAVLPILEPELALAEVLLQKHALERRLRALDSIQMASALRLQVQSRVDYFVAADTVLCEVARLEGFTTLNPERP
jgi:predicted nucleic acid-binding protein